MEIELNRLKAHSQQENARLLGMLEVYQHDENGQKYDQEQQLMQLDIVKDFKSYNPEEGLPSVVQWKSLEKTMALFLPDFYKKLESHHAHLTRLELRICLLIRLSFTTDEMAALIDVSKQSISNYKNKLNLRMFHEKGAKGFEQHIKDL